MAGRESEKCILPPKESEPLDRARLHQRLQDSAVVAGRLAHAFDNVLTGILGFTELTLSQLDAESPQYRFLTEVLQAAQQGAQLTQQLHTYSRCGTPHPGSTQLASLVSEEEGHWRKALEGNVTLQVAVPADLPAVAVETEALRQALTRVMDNAREAVTGGGTISVTARRVELTPADCQNLLGQVAPGPHVEVIVADTGTGITPEARRRILTEPFFSSKPRHQGLGLAITYRILHAYHGGMQVGSSPERGTAVRLVLPTMPRPT